MDDELDRFFFESRPIDLFQVFKTRLVIVVHKKQTDVVILVQTHLLRLFEKLVVLIIAWDVAEAQFNIDAGFLVCNHVVVIVDCIWDGLIVTPSLFEQRFVEFILM